jgi:hypothetical protein
MAGILAGFAAVICSIGDSFKKGEWKWPLMAFFRTGFIDASFKLFQINGVDETQFPELITTIFGFAFIVGLIHYLFSNNKKIRLISVFSAVVLGLINFATVYFLLLALAELGWDSSVVYSVNNFGVVALSAIAAMILFREKLDTRTWVRRFTSHTRYRFAFY